METPQPTAAPSLTPPPRAVTLVVRRRAWGEPHVRFWWLGAVALFVAAACLLATRYANWREGVALIHSGVPVQAKVLVANGTTSP